MRLAAERRLPTALRARLTPGRLALAAALVAAFLGLVALLEGDEKRRSAPVDRAARLVPGDALIYAHLTIDRESDQWRRAGKIVDSFPTLGRLRGQVLAELARRGRVRNLGRQIEPWLGDEAALALLPGDIERARSLILIGVSDRALARSYLAQAVGTPRVTHYRGARIEHHGELATAFVDDFLAIGRVGNLHAAIDSRFSRSLALDRDPGFLASRAALAKRGTAPLLSAFASPQGLRAVLRSRKGVVGRLARLLDDRDLEGAAATLSAEERGVSVRYAGALSSERSEARLRAEAARRFSPRLVSALPESAIAYFGMRGVDSVLSGLETVLGAGSEALSSLRRLGPELGSGDRGRLERLLRPVRRKEAALFALPSREAPILTMVADDLDEGTAANLLSRLQPLFERSSATGQVATLEPARIAGIDAATIRLSPNLAVTYAVIGRRAVVSTSPDGLRALRTARRRLIAKAQLAALIRARGQTVTSVLFLDLERLLGLGERAGLGLIPAYQRLEADLTQIKSVSAVTSSTTQAKAADIFIEVQ